jgi:hypothetical protein
MTRALLWLEQTPWSVWVREYPSLFGFPFILFLHTLGLAMLAGVSMAISLWLLRNPAITHTARMTGLNKVMWLGFLINALSGVVLLLGYPAKALTNPLFYAKMLLVLLGVYAVVRINREMFPANEAVPGTTVTVGARRWAIASLLIWATVILSGRFLAYTYRVLFADELL